jgi:F-type H+-transporting ATPase subunit gamma
MLDLYEEGKTDRLYLVSNRFVNSMVQKPTMLQLLPAETVDAADLQEKWDYITSRRRTS